MMILVELFAYNDFLAFYLFFILRLTIVKYLIYYSLASNTKKNLFNSN